MHGAEEHGGPLVVEGDHDGCGRQVGGVVQDLASVREWTMMVAKPLLLRTAPQVAFHQCVIIEFVLCSMCS